MSMIGLDLSVICKHVKMEVEHAEKEIMRVEHSIMNSIEMWNFWLVLDSFCVVTETLQKFSTELKFFFWFCIPLTNNLPHKAPYNLLQNAP